MERLPDVYEHVAAVAAQQPSLLPGQIDVIREIVFLRRRIDVQTHFERFRKLLSEGGEDLLQSFSTRWLVSIADTIADFGSPIERGNAMIIVVLANVTKLAETERRIFSSTQVDELRREECASGGAPLWDGMQTYGLKQGDMPNNMWTRIRTVMESTPQLLFIFESVLYRMINCNTLIGRLASLNPTFYCRLSRAALSSSASGDDRADQTSDVKSL